MNLTLNNGIGTELRSIENYVIFQFCQFSVFLISIFFRYKERLENVQSRAFESTVQRYSTDEAASSSSMPPILQAYLPRKKCEICKVIIHNEVQLQSHLRGRKHKDQVSVANDGRKLSGYVFNTYIYNICTMGPRPLSIMKSKLNFHAPAI